MNHLQHVVKNILIKYNNNNNNSFNVSRLLT